jgi:hypothetical protein
MTSKKRKQESMTYYYEHRETILAKAREMRRFFRSANPLPRKSEEHKKAVNRAGNKRWCAENPERRREIARLSYHRRKGKKTCA